jgi:hypothetical protein
MNALEIRTLDEFQKHYFPEQYEQEKVMKMTPEQYAKYLAEETLKPIKKSLIKALKNFNCNR